MPIKKISTPSEFLVSSWPSYGYGIQANLGYYGVSGEMRYRR
jgi:hypothetical protein